MKTGPYPVTEKSVYQKTCTDSSFDLKADNRNSNVPGAGDMLIDENLLSIDDKSCSDAEGGVFEMTENTA